MRIAGWGTLALTLILAQSGCWVDAVVRDQDRQIDSLQEENNVLRQRNAELLSQQTAVAPEGDETNAALELQKQLEALGIKVTAHGGIIVVTLVNSILFDSGQTKFKAGATRALDEVVRVLGERFPDQMIRVEGHTDNVPVNKVKNLYPSNWELSSARALAVLRYLLSKGVKADKIYAAAFGETSPADTNTTEAGRAHNRRVEIVILPKLPVSKESVR
jgi:chemotaxis protein MotB